MVIAGSTSRLGEWNPQAALELQGDTWPIWSTQLSLPIGFKSTYKIAVLGRDLSLTWERGSNRRLHIPTNQNEYALKLTPYF